MVTRRLQAERRTGSVRRPKTGVPPTVLRNHGYGCEVYRRNVLAQPEIRHTVYLSLTSITLNRRTDSFVDSVTIFLLIKHITYGKRCPFYGVRRVLNLFVM